MRDSREYSGRESAYERNANAYYRENRPRRMRERETGKRRRTIGFVIVCLLLVMNILLLLEIRVKVSGMDRELDRVTSRVSAGGQKEDTSLPETGTKEDVPNRTYASAGTDARDTVDYVSLCGLDEVDMPVDRSPEEVLTYLEKLSRKNDQVAQIWEDHYLYPDSMLKALANNPEMADFVRNSLSGSGSGKAEISALEKGQDYPLFLQWDPRWGYENYGDDNIGLSGCGPTCVSMAMYYLLRDDEITPKTVAEYGMANGHYVPGTGTAWALLEEYPLIHGINVEQPSVSEQTMKDALDRGSVIICSMGPGDFTAGGHFVVIYGYDSKGFLINDSNCVARSRQRWDFARLEWQIKHMWVYGI
ncbi:MAG: hypothetical protein HFH93_02665 [Lachnospiraceae bacterium]|nr:hypothetical protein [Lachnospiraceae bacterium]